MSRLAPIPKADRQQSSHHQKPGIGETSEQNSAQPYADVLKLQRAVGNQAVSQLLSQNQKGITSVARSLSSPISPISSVLHSPGHSLDRNTRTSMERHFNQDLSQVQVHTSSQAALSAEAINAKAYTVGEHVVFGQGQFAPDTREGKRLLAHELTHVLQQRSSSQPNPQTLNTSSLAIAPDHDPQEQEAEAQGDRFLHHEFAPPPADAPNDPKRTLKPSTRPRITPAPSGQIRRAAWGGVLGGILGGGLVGVGLGLLGLLGSPLLGIVLGVIGGVLGAVGGAWLGHLLTEKRFDEAELLAYLGILDGTGRIEGRPDSDRKARAIVEAWRQGNSPYVLTSSRVILLLRELLFGNVEEGDRQSILELLERSSNEDLSLIFGAGGISARELSTAFTGDAQQQLTDFFRRRFEGGLSRVLAGQIRPIGAPVPLGTPLGERPQPEEDREPTEQRGSCSLQHPEHCATYEDWLHHFAALPTFRSITGHRVIGPEAAPTATATDTTAPPARRRPIPLTGRFSPTDRFIDGPTDAWVREHFPPNLVETAYQLPSDCADMAVILRHVWLAAHGRTETYRGWVCGSRARDARSQALGELLTQEIFSGNVARILNPYADEGGNPIRSFDRLQAMLHPGDVLVWRHPGSGGHTQTIMDIRRVGDRITELRLLQGNQPIGREQAEEIHAANPAGPSVRALRDAPGRRIEVNIMSGGSLQDSNGIWTWADGTVLVAAGPPGIARPDPVRRGQRQLIDWQRSLQTANENDLPALFEAALLELRSLLERGQAVTEADARQLGQATGERLWELAQAAADFAHESHYRRLQDFRAMAIAIRDDSRAANAAEVFNWLLTAFNLAARGATSINFQRRIRGSRQVVRILLTGFDPFNMSDVTTAPRPGDWNPSGAAVLALDGRTVENVAPNVVAAVEGVVLPVSFREFRTGLVESILQPHLTHVDAVITVSLDPSITLGQPVRLEQFAVGVHHLLNDRLEAIPAAPGQGGAGPAILATRAPLTDIAAAAERSATGQEPAVPRPTIGTDVTLRFTTMDTAHRAIAALGLTRPAQFSVTQSRTGAIAEIRDPLAIQQIINSMQRDVSSATAGITFRAGGQTFQSIIESGPGGSFLSNEVAFRTQRLIGTQTSGTPPLSFHVHTQQGGVIPADTTTPQGQQALASAQQVRGTLIATLEQVIRATARQVSATEPSETGTR